MIDHACVQLRVLWQLSAVIGVVVCVARMGLGPLVGLAVGFDVAILIAGKENHPRNPIASAQWVF